MPLPNLPNTITTSITLLSRFESTLSTPSLSQDSKPDSPSPAPLLKASALATKSHVTKLSLLTITAPFTPSAIIKILNELNTAVLPSLVTATLLSIPEKFTEKFHDETITLSSRILKSLIDLVKSVEKAGTNDGVEGSSELKDEVTALTGRVWEACDEAIALADGGVVGFVVRKAGEWQSLVSDALTELKEWDPEDADEEDPFGETLVDDDGEDDDTHEEDGEEDKDDEVIKKMRDAALKMLTAVEKIYPPIIRCRLKTFPADAPKESIRLLDNILASLKGFPDKIDELAEALYDKNPSEIMRCVLEIRDLRDGLIDMDKGFSENWNGKPDEFTLWFGKWSTVVRKLCDATNETVQSVVGLKN